MDANFQLIDLSYLELMADGDADMKQTMLEMILEEIPTELSKMNQLLQEKNWKELQALSHKLKSTFAFVGNADLTETNQTLERILKRDEQDGKLEQISALMHQLLIHYPPVVEELRKALKTS